MVNLIATIAGGRKDRIVFAGHYDTKRFTRFRFVGASDGGSSAAFVIELACVLKPRRNPFTIELLFLDGEEAVNEVWAGTDNTYGSRHYVETAQPHRLAGRPEGARAPRHDWPSQSRDPPGDALSRVAQSDRLGTRPEGRNSTATSSPRGTQVEDDHLPFVQAGVPSVDIIDLDYPQWHTAQDTLDAVSARSLQVVGDVVLAALPDIEKRLASSK